MNSLIQDVFTEIYERNVWGNRPVSGPGSSLLSTRVIRESIPILLEKYKIKSILDIPCGDMTWMQFVDLEGIDYIGADIVEELIYINCKKFKWKFTCMDIVSDRMPQMDLIVSRDCLVHLSQNDAMRAIDNVIQSRSTYFLTTTFPKHKNKDIYTGQWHPYNLQQKPFLFSHPLELINEGLDGMYKDKSLGMWEVSTLKR